jgi:hypothetical protein
MRATAPGKNDGTDVTSWCPESMDPSHLRLRAVMAQRAKRWRHPAFILGLVVGALVHPVNVLRVRLRPFPKLQRRLRTTGSRAADPRARALADGLAVAARRHPFQVTCVPQSLTVHAVLRRLGYESRIVIGAKSPAEFMAHAWVEVAGEPVGETTDVQSDFAVLLRLPRESANDDEHG